MSHITEERTDIYNPDMTALGEAVKLVAQQRGGTVQETYLDFWGRVGRTNLNLALFVPGLEYGIGLMLDADGALTFQGDNYEVVELYNQVQTEIKQAYVAYGYILSLKELGFDVATTDDPTGQRMLILEGESYVA
jgi:hypothetical protein